MRPTLPVIVALAVLVSAGFGADLSAAEIIKSNVVHCDLKLQGAIESGDFERPRDQLDKAERLCLNSPGGSYFDGIKLFQHIAESKIKTAVEASDSCLSACAIAFMGGADGAYGDRFPARTIYAGGVLGFHSPFLVGSVSSKLPSEVNNLAFGIEVGVRVVAALLRADKFNLLPKRLLAEMLETPSSSIYAIDTLAKIALADVALAGIAAPAKITKSMLYRACVNSDPWQSDAEAPKPDEVKQNQVAVLDRSNRYRIIFQGFELQGMSSCAVEVVKNESDTEIFIKIEYGDLSRVAMTESDKKPSWLLFPRDTKILHLSPLAR